jgi:tRNA 5-methylaminomethyl-2-thiouridine biosynthesis bifunctional protein
MSKKFTPIEKADLIWNCEVPSTKPNQNLLISTRIFDADEVYIQGNRLIERWQHLSEHQDSFFVIAETGFGTGLNFLLTYKYWKQYAPPSARLFYITCEQHPLAIDDLRKCFQLWPELTHESQSLLSCYPILTPGIHTLEFDEGKITLQLMLGNVLKMYRQLLICGDSVLEQKLRTHWVDAWFLNGFAPTRGAEVERRKLFAVISKLSRKGTTTSSFSVASTIKNNLQEIGFDYEVVTGSGLQSDLVRGYFHNITEVHCGRETPWHISSRSLVASKSAIVLGAGLAGCYMGYALAKRGWNIQLLDSQSDSAQGASGNCQAILYPKLSYYHSPLTEFMLYAYLYAVRAYKKIIKNHPEIGNSSGIFQLAYNDRELNSQEKMQEWIYAYPELGELLNQSSASELTGIELTNPGLFIPSSGWFNLPMLCEVLRQHENISWVPNCKVDDIKYKNGIWHSGSHAAEVLIITTGHNLSEFKQTRSLPYKSIRGQMTAITMNRQTQGLKIPICADVHILPPQKGIHWIGSTYCPGENDSNCKNHDNELNIQKLQDITNTVLWGNKSVDQWAGVRGAAPDYLPFVGPVADEYLFKSRFSGLKNDAKRWIPSAGIFYPDLYVCAGFGSRGLTSIPLSGEWLAGYINLEPTCLPRNLIQAISPARFLYREIIRKSKELS